MVRSSQGVSNAIPVIITTVVLLLVALGTVPLVGQAQDTINNSKNALPEGALDTGSDGDSEEDGEPGVTGPEDGDSETGQDGAFTGVQFNNPPEAVAAGNTEMFKATASADQPLERATFYVTSDGGPSGSEVSASCDEGTECTVEKQLSFPGSEDGEGYSANVEVQFSTGPGSLGGRAQTTTQVVSVELNRLSDSGEFSASADAAEPILTQARLRWTTQADVEPSESIAKTVECTLGGPQNRIPGNPSSCDIPSTSLDLPDSLGGAYQVDVIAEFDTEEGQVAATTTTGVDSNPGLEFEVKNNGGEPVSGIEVSVQGESTTTNDNGVARFDSLGDSTIDEISLYCDEPPVQNTKEQYSIDPSTRNTFELDLPRGVEECTSTQR